MPKTFGESTKGHVLLMIDLLIVEHGAQNCLLTVKSTLRVLVSSISSENNQAGVFR